MELREPYNGKHAVVPMKRKAGVRYCLSEIDAKCALDVIEREGFEKVDDKEGFIIESKTTHARFKPEVFVLEDEQKKPKRGKDMTIPKGEPTDGEQV